MLTGIGERSLALAAVGLLGAPGSPGKMPWSSSARAPEAAAERLAAVRCGSRAATRRFGNVGFLTKQCSFTPNNDPNPLVFCVVFSRVVCASGAEIVQLQKRIA